MLVKTFIDLRKNSRFVAYKERVYRSSRHTSWHSCTLLFSVCRVLWQHLSDPTVGRFTSPNAAVHTWRLASPHLPASVWAHVTLRCLESRQAVLETVLISYSVVTVITFCTEQNPSSEANSSSAIQEIPDIMWKSDVHNHTDNSPSHVPLLIQITAYHPISLWNVLLLSSGCLRLGLPSCIAFNWTKRISVIGS